jgi:lipopolysaccharide export system permease protein
VSCLWILWRRAFGELLAHTAIGLGAITLVIVVGNVLRFLEDVAGSDIGLAAVGRLTAAILPSFLCYSIPTAVVFGVLITLGRMASDGETLALKASGISTRQMFPPVLAVGIAASLLTGYLMAEPGPRSYARMKQIARELARDAALLDPGEFREIAGRVLYFQSRGAEDCRMRGVVISGLGAGDEDLLTTGRCGTFLERPEDGELTFRLSSGSLHLGDGSGERFQLVHFDSMELPLDVSGTLAERHWPREFTTPELVELEATSNTRSEEWRRLLWVQLHRRIAFPLGSVVLVLVAFPLGFRPIRAGRSAGALTAVALVTGYWIATDAGETLAESGWLTPALGIWLPDLLFLVGGMALVYCSARRAG